MAVDFNTKVLGPAHRVFGYSAVYTPPIPPSGAPVAVTVILGREEAPEIDGPLAVIAARLTGQIRVSELAAPAEGGSLAVTLPNGVKTYTVRARTLDIDGTTWTLDLDEA